MKQLTCEMCGGTDLIKQDGVFVCQSCGAKYSVEEAKKMMVDVVMDTSKNNDKVNKDEIIKNYIMIANNARNSGNSQEAESYCNKIIEIDSSCAEAWLLKGISAGRQSSPANIRMDEFVECAKNAFASTKTINELNDYVEKAFKEYYTLMLAINKLVVDSIIGYPEGWKGKKYYIQLELQNIVREMKLQSAYVTVLKAFYQDKPEEENVKPRDLWTEFHFNDLHKKCDEQVIDGALSLWNTALEKYNLSSDGFPTDYMLEYMMKEGMIAIQMLDSKVPEDISDIKESQYENTIKACKNLIMMYTVLIDLKSYKVRFSNGIESHPVSKELTFAAKKDAVDAIRRYHDVIKACDPSYEIPEIPTVVDSQPRNQNQATNTSSGGCYVATAVYGSYDCPQVWTLRRFRDYTLAETWYGRAFIRTYYAISPTLVKWFGHTEWFKKMWKRKLDRMVANLNAEGVEDTPYEDRIW